MPQVPLACLDRVGMSGPNCGTIICHCWVNFKSNSTRAPCRQHYRKPVPIAFLCKRKPQSHLYFRQWTNKNEAKQQQPSPRAILGCSSPPTPLALLFHLLPIWAFLLTGNRTAKVVGKLVGTTVAFGYQRQFLQPGGASASLLPILSWGRGDCVKNGEKWKNFPQFSNLWQSFLLFLFTPGSTIQQVQIEDDK